MWWMLAAGAVGLVVGTLFGWCTAPDDLPPYPSSVMHDYAYGRMGRGRSFYFGPGDVISTDAFKEKQMKQCHACGQRLPLKVGQMVEFASPFKVRRKETGIVIRAQGAYVSVLGLDGCGHEIAPAALTRLHGYYRITEREPLA